MSQKTKKKLSQKSSKNEKIASQNSSSQDEENISSDFPFSTDSNACDYEILKSTDVIKLMDHEIQKIHEVVDVSTQKKLCKIQVTHSLLYFR
jgi:hypothetical protein